MKFLSLIVLLASSSAYADMSLSGTCGELLKVKKTSETSMKLRIKNVSGFTESKTATEHASFSFTADNSSKKRWIEMIEEDPSLAALHLSYVEVLQGIGEVLGDPVVVCVATLTLDSQTFELISAADTREEAIDQLKSLMPN